MTTSPKAGPKDFFLWAGFIITLYASFVAFITLIFSYLNVALPDDLSYYVGMPNTSYQTAVLIVLFPLFLVIASVIRAGIRRDYSRAETWVRRWALYLTLFLAGAVVAGDLITLIMYFLNGDMTLRFILKVIVLLIVPGGVFLHFLADLWGYWIHHPSHAQAVAWGSALVVLLAIVSGFFIIGTPGQMRDYRYDDERVADLQSIQYELINYWQSKSALPVELSDLHDSVSGFVLPTDPRTGAEYEYILTGTNSFQLCAAFAAPTRRQAEVSRPVAPDMKGDLYAEPWNHEAGRTCFARTIDSDKYPPYPKRAE